MGTNGIYGHAAKCQNLIVHAVSPVSPDMYVESLIQFYIFLARKYASCGLSVYCRNYHGGLWHSRAVSHSQNIVHYHFALT